ncbi:MAG: glycosyltransferase family 2 protein, partial [Lachnospiraceae bacterium]|nr:glycosyltransferase family 2 protein [Lachnospiraceae bacterium]
MMDEVKVSVIVPVYNTEKYLPLCLDSLVKQTLSSLEIVIVNDGSTDGSEAVINDFINAYPARIQYFTQKNMGQAVARNKALIHCKGEYVGFLDSDDF